MTKSNRFVLGAMVFCTVFSEVASAQTQADALSREASRYLVHPNYSRSGSYEPVTETNLRLLGGGMQGRKSGQVLSVACIGNSEPCEILRFVLFPSPKEAFYVGPFFRLHPQGNDSQQRTLNKAISGYRKRENYGTRSAIGVSTFAGVFLGGIAIAITGGGAGFFMAVGSFLATCTSLKHGGTDAIMWDFFTPVTRTFSSSFTVLSNQNGWNWSTRTTHVREKFFGKFVTNLLYGFEDMNKRGVKAVERVSEEEVQKILLQAEPAVN